MTETVAVQRHRTAMVRYSLSQPMALMVRYGLVGCDSTVFDYGCGQGDDLRALESQGIMARGWDPHYAPSTPISSAQIVNLGFVLNVIEDEAERRHALRRAWEITEKVLAVSVMVVGQVPTDGLRPYCDGYLTSRGTFQKYFQHADLRSFITSVTGAEPVSVTTGIYFLFRRSDDEQEFLLDRRRSMSRASIGFSTRERPYNAPTRLDLADRIPHSLDEIVAFATHRGRLPIPEELSERVRDELTTTRVSLARAIDLCRATALDNQALEAAASRRREDLLVHNALCILNRSRSLQNPGAAIVRDIRALFGSQKALTESATRYLFALSDFEALHRLSIESTQRGTGIFDEKERLVISGDRTEDLPGPLRCYLGCATYLSGEPDGVYVVRIDPRKRLVKLFMIRDPNAAAPEIRSTIGIDLKRQRVFSATETLHLVRKIDVFGIPPTPSRRKRERALQSKLKIPATQIFMAEDSPPPRKI